MTTDRRKFLAGLFGAPAVATALTVPVQAAVPEPMPVPPPVEPVATKVEKIQPWHPLFGYQEAHEKGKEVTQIFVFNSCFPKDSKPEIPRQVGYSTPRVSINIMKEVVCAYDTSGQKVLPHFHATVDQAEDAILDKLAGVWEVFPEAGANLRTVLTEAGNRIHADTRRGAGNVLVMHRADLPLLGDLLKPDSEIEPGRVKTRWGKAGIVMNAIKVWVSDNPPPSIARGTALLGYRANQMDAGAIIVGFVLEDGREAYGTYLRDEHSHMAGMIRASSEDYFHSIHLT